MDEVARRIEEGLAILRSRFGAKMRATPSLSDTLPAGSGPVNAHGMPKLPPGQNELASWPVLEFGEQPDVSTERWALTVDGAVAEPLVLRWGDFQALPQVEEVADFHCVTNFSVLDKSWKGVRLATLLALARPLEEATHLMTHGYDGYTTNMPLEEALKDDVLLVHAVDGAPLPSEHGGPVRVITPQLYAWKGAKWVKRLELMSHDRRGYWEIRGYSNTAHPWRNDRSW